MALDASEWSTSCSQPLNPHERTLVEASWNVMAHTQKTDFVFRWNGPVHLNGRGRQFSQLLAAEVCASAVVMLDTPCSEVVWRVLATHSVRQFPLHFPSRVSPCAITFQLKSTHCLEAGLALPLHLPVSPSLPLPCVTVCRHISTGVYPLLRSRVGPPTPFASFPFTSPPVRHRVPSHFNWSLPTA